MVSQIYTFLNKEKLAEITESFYACIGLPMQILDEKGHVLEQYGSRCEYCKHFISHLSTSSVCDEIHAKAGVRALSLGESYIFSCHSNLIHIVFPLTHGKTLLGSVLVGPFLMEEPDSSLIMDISRHYPDLTTEDLMELYDDSQYISRVEPAKVTQISKLLYYLFSGLVSESREQLFINQNKLYQQAKISESIHRFKNAETEDEKEYPYEKEHEFLMSVKRGDMEQSRLLLNELLGYLFLLAGNNISELRSRSIELCTLLSRTAMENGAPPNQTLRLNNEYLKNLQNYNTIDDLCYALNEVLTTFIDSMFPLQNDKKNTAIQQAMRYIKKHYSSNITLMDVAEHVHLTPTYFSRLFKQETDSTFKEYLTTIRLEESKRLLQSTDYSLLDIAIATGFEDQSYFSRVFKKHTGVTPSQFR